LRRNLNLKPKLVIYTLISDHLPPERVVLRAKFYRFASTRRMPLSRVPAARKSIHPD